MSICIDTYKADPRLILGYHVVPGQWLLQGGTTGGGGVMRWFEHEFAGYEREMEKKDRFLFLDQLNAIAAAVAPGCDGLVFLPYMAGERSPIWNPEAKGVFYGLDFSKTKGHMVRACMEGVALSLRHNLEVAGEAGAPGAGIKGNGAVQPTPCSGHRLNLTLPGNPLWFHLPIRRPHLGPLCWRG